MEPQVSLRQSSRESGSLWYLLLLSYVTGQITAIFLSHVLKEQLLKYNDELSEIAVWV